MSDSLVENNQNISNELNCKDCGALLHFSPGNQKLICKYCGAKNEIISESKEEIKIEEIDYEKFISKQLVIEETQTLATVNCKNCGATTTLKPNITSDICVFCASPLVIKEGSTSTIIKPKYILPFSIENKIANESFDKWLKALWFAPNDLIKRSSLSEKINGVYMPYWTFDAKSTCKYEGERGDDYESKDSKGNTQTKTRWTDVSGEVSNIFDDICVIASTTLPVENTIRLEPWDQEKLQPFNEAFLSGFQAECYRIEVREGLKLAKIEMYYEIRSTINADIGGDHQRIGEMNPIYKDITFKHALFPIWISAYKYNNKVYRFIVNGRTGKVDGQRPISMPKVAITVSLILAIIVSFEILIFSMSEDAILPMIVVGIIGLCFLANFSIWYKKDFRTGSDFSRVFKSLKK